MKPNARAKFSDQYILETIDTILKDPPVDRKPRLEELLGLVKKIDVPLFLKLTNGLWLYYAADDKVKSFRASRGSDTYFYEESHVREQAIQMYKDAIHNLEESRKLASGYLESPSEKRAIGRIVDDHWYMATIHLFRQELNLCMSNLQYEKAREICERGRTQADVQHTQAKDIENREEREKKRKGCSQDINLFAAHLKEIDAYEKLDRPFWDSRSIDFLEAARSFQEAVECLGRAVPEREGNKKDRALSDLTDIPKALMYLLRFVAKPTLNNIDNLASYRELEQSSPLLKGYLAATETRGMSKRKNRMIRLVQFFKLYTYKIACWEIFSELRCYANKVETFVSKNKGAILIMFTELLETTKDMSKREEVSERRKKYEVSDNIVTVDRFVDDVKRYFPDLLPATVGNEKQSIVIANDLFHWIKHPILQSTETARFTEELIDRVVENRRNLGTLTLDTDRFLDKMRSIILRWSRTN